MDFTSVNYCLFYTCQVVGENGSVVGQDLALIYLKKANDDSGRIVHFHSVWCSCDTSYSLVTAWFKETCTKAYADNVCMLHFLFRMSWKKEILHCYCIVTYL